MSERHVATFLTDTERKLIVALLEERLKILVETRSQAGLAGDTPPIPEQVKIAVALLNELHLAAADQFAATPPERTSAGDTLRGSTLASPLQRKRDPS